jgi:pimeloyl-ACP methyl ester carboxylesterase
MRTTRHRIEGLQITALHEPAPAGRDRVDQVLADPVVMVPGLALSGRTLLPAVQAFAQFVDVWAVDLPGAGSSSAPDRAFDVDDHARTLLSWCDAAGLRRVTLLGHSVGCQPVLAAAEQDPERVAAVVLSAPTGDPRARDWATFVGRWLLDGLREPPRQLPRLVHDWLRADPRTAASTLAALRRDDVADRLSGVSCPALVLRGERDAIAPQGWAEHLARQLPRGRLVVLSGQPHNALTLAAHEAAALVRAFLTEVLEA